jgi:hypothetical protein
MASGSQSAGRLNRGWAVSKDSPNLRVRRLPPSGEVFTCSGWFPPTVLAYDFAAGLIGGNTGAAEPGVTS